MREVIPFLLLVCACGAASWSNAPSEGSSRGDDEARGPRDASAGPSAPDPKFASLETRAASVAPGMRRAAERENQGERVELIRAGERDVCVRVVFEASAPVVAKLVDRDGHPLTETPAAATQGALGEQGPVCIRKGDSVSALVDGTAMARVRWLAMASP